MNLLYTNQRQYIKAKSVTSTIPTTLSTNPNRTISQVLIFPLANTIALGGVDIGIINEKLAQMVSASIVIAGSLPFRKDCVAV